MENKHGQEEELIFKGSHINDKTIKPKTHRF